MKLNLTLKVEALLKSNVESFANEKKSYEKPIWRGLYLSILTAVV